MPREDRTIVVLEEPARGRSQGHPWVFLAAVTGLLAGLLYFLRGKSGWRGGGGLLGDGSETPRVPSDVPAPIPTSPPVLEPEPIQDPVSLTFVLVSPTFTDPTKPTSFRGPDSKLYTLDELVARVKAGGRKDVTLKILGTIRQGAVASIKSAINAAGLEIYDSKPAASVGRGVYR